MDYAMMRRKNLIKMNALLGQKAKLMLEIKCLKAEMASHDRALVLESGYI